MTTIFTQLDDTCKNLFQYLLMRDITGEEPIRFNELLRRLKDDGFSISRPTLSLHLSHLVEKKIVKRTEIDRQNVSYRFYRENWTGLKESIEKNAKIAESFSKEKQNFLSEPISEQVAFMSGVLFLRIVYQLKAELLSYSDPENKFNYQLQIYSFNNMWSRFIEWVVRSYRISEEEKQQEFIKELDSLIEMYREVLFVERPINN